MEASSGLVQPSELMLDEEDTDFPLISHKLSLLTLPHLQFGSDINMISWETDVLLEKLILGGIRKII